jgi:serine/threonine-protein kinase
VLLNGDHAYLSDFGLTRLVDAETEITQSGQWMGTVDYCSPEQLQGLAIDARADVYSLGCVLYAALTGEAPFHRGTVPSTMAAQLHDPPPRPSQHGARPEFDRVVARALAKGPADRYPSAGDLGRAALAAARGEAVTESERSVAIGPAAPDAATVNGHDLPTAATAHATAATRVAGPEAEAARSVYRPVRLLRSAAVALGLVAILAGIGLALGALLGTGGAAARRGPLSEDEVRSVAEAFASAYTHEDASALRHTLSRNVLRVLPSGVAHGREQVVAQYARQFDGKVRGYTFTDLTVTGGSAGRASGDYRVDRDGSDPIQGRIALGVVREGGVPRIRLIAATPQA